MTDSTTPETKKGEPFELPTWKDFCAYHSLKWEFVRAASRYWTLELLQKNWTRIVLGGLAIVFISFGIITQDWLRAVLWSFVFVIGSVLLTMFWIYFVSPVSVVANLRRRVGTLESTVQRQSLGKELAVRLTELFNEGFELLQVDRDAEAPMFEWAERYKGWRGRVADVLKEASLEEEFMFRSAGYEHDIYLFKELREAERTGRETARALTAKMNKLRLITSRSYSKAERVD